MVLCSGIAVKVVQLKLNRVDNLETARLAVVIEILLSLM